MATKRAAQHHSLPCAVDAKRTPLNRTFFSWVHPRADRNTHLARPRSVKHRAPGSLADFPDCASASARRSPIFAQAAAQRFVASVAQNPPPHGSRTQHHHFIHRLLLLMTGQVGLDLGRTQAPGYGCSLQCFDFIAIITA